MNTPRLTQAHPATAAAARRQGHTPPPLRLPKFLQKQLAKPLQTADDVDALVEQIRIADARGLLQVFSGICHQPVAHGDLGQQMPGLGRISLQLLPQVAHVDAQVVALV